MALERLGLRDLLASPTAQALSHNRLVDGCVCPNASNTTLNHTPCCALRNNNAAYSDSPAIYCVSIKAYLYNVNVFILPE
jgi:hypothetical protein